MERTRKRHDVLSLDRYCIRLCLPAGNDYWVRPRLSSFTSLALMGGLEGKLGATLRALAGPAVFHDGTRGTAAGLLGRADLASPPLLHISIVASARGEVIPNFDGHVHGMMGFGFGVRIQ